MGKQVVMARLMVKLDVGADADEREVDQATRTLRAELLRVDIESADIVRAGAAPQGTKGFGIETLGALAVKLVPGALKSAIQAIQAWVARDAGRSAKLVVDGESIEVSSVTSLQQQQLIDAWIVTVSRKLDAR
jgi:hypothetical protein